MASFHLLTSLRELSSFTLVPAILLPEPFLSLILSHLTLVSSSCSFREEAISFSSSPHSTRTTGTRLNESWKGGDFYHSRAKGKIKTAYATPYNREKTTTKYRVTFAEDTYEKQWPFSGENLSLNHKAFAGLFFNSPFTALLHIGRFSPSYGINPDQHCEFCQFSQTKR